MQMITICLKITFIYRSGNSTYGTGSQYPPSYNNYPQTCSSTGAYQAGNGNYPSNYSTQAGYESTPDYSHSKFCMTLVYV